MFVFSALRCEFLQGEFQAVSSTAAHLQRFILPACIKVTKHTKRRFSHHIQLITNTTVYIHKHLFVELPGHESIEHSDVFSGEITLFYCMFQTL